MQSLDLVVRNDYRSKTMLTVLLEGTIPLLVRAAVEGEVAVEDEVVAVEEAVVVVVLAVMEVEVVALQEGNLSAQENLREHQ